VKFDKSPYEFPFAIQEFKTLSLVFCAATSRSKELPIVSASLPINKSFAAVAAYIAACLALSYVWIKSFTPFIVFCTAFNSCS